MVTTRRTPGLVAITRSFPVSGGRSLRPSLARAQRTKVWPPRTRRPAERNALRSRAVLFDHHRAANTMHSPPPCGGRVKAKCSQSAGLNSTRWQARRDHTFRSTISFLISAIALAGFEALGADLGAVHDGVAAVEAERIFQLVEPLAGHLVAAVGEPAIGLQQDGGARGSCPSSTSSSGTRWSSRRTGCTRRARRASARSRALQPFLLRRRRCPSAARAESRRTGRRSCVKSGTRSLTTSMCGSGMIVTAPLMSSIAVVQASPLVPSMFIEQEPQMPSRQERRKVRVGSISFLILISASRTIGPQSSVST